MPLTEPSGTAKPLPTGSTFAAADDDDDAWREVDGDAECDGDALPELPEVAAVGVADGGERDGEAVRDALALRDGDGDTLRAAALLDGEEETVAERELTTQARSNAKPSPPSRPAAPPPTNATAP